MPTGAAEKGISAASFKCGPDYIDPMFHQRVLGIPGENLDLFFADAKTLQRQIACYEQRCKIAVLEGVMGYYDGLGGVSDRDSTWDVACATNTPVILVVRPKGASLTIAAQVQGMLSFRKETSLQAFCSMAVRKGWRGCLHRCWRNRPGCRLLVFALCGRCFF